MKNKHTDLLGFEILDENVVRRQIRQVIKEASCRQKSQELADSYSAEELQSRLDQIMRDMEQEAEPEGGPISDMYADEMDAYEGAIRIARGSSDTPLTYDQAIGRDTSEGTDAISTARAIRSGLGEGEKIGQTSYKTRTAVVTAPGVTEDKEIFIDNINTLDNVTIRWRGANHWGNKTLTNLVFEPESPGDDDLFAISNDSKWLFIVDKDEETGEVDWDTLIIDSRELENVADDGTSTYSVPPEDMVEQGFDDRFDKAMTGAGFSSDEKSDIMSRDIGNNSFGSAGTDKRTQQVITDIIQLIKSTDIDPMDVMEVIGEEFKIKFEFSGGAPDGDNINPGNTKDQDTKRKAYNKMFGDKSPGQR